MRVCLVSAALPDTACGVGDYTDHLATALAAAGAEPVVLTTARSELRQGAPYEVKSIATEWRLAEATRLARAVAATRPEIVHIQFPGFGYGRGFGVTALPWVGTILRPRVPTAITLHEFDRLSRLHRLRVAAGAVPCRLVLAVGEDVYGSARRYLGRRPWSEVVLTRIASNLDPASGSERRSRDLRRSADELVVGYWGFLRPDKGLRSLVDAFASVRSRRPARLVIAGDPGPDAAYAEQVHEWVREASLIGDVLFTGPLPADELSATLLGFDVCVLPFRDGLSENRGTYAAAVAHGLPIVTTSREREGLDLETNTTFVPPGDAAALAQAVLAPGAGAVRAIGEAVRVPRPDTEREWAAIARQHLELYEKLLAR